MRNLLGLTALFIAASVLPAFAQQTAKPDQFFAHQHIPLAAVPTSSAPALAPASPGPAGVTIVSMFFVNTNSSTIVTVTVSCTTSGNVLIQAAIPGVTAGGNNIPVQLPADGVWCAGGVTWIASAAGVNGTISGRY